VGTGNRLCGLSKAGCATLPGWNHTKLTMEHVNFGGVTDGLWVVHLDSSNMVQSFTSMTQAPHDASTILDNMVNNGRSCKPPPILNKTSTPELILL